ncbi:dual specificity protein phosphatase 19-like isoform X1 [Xiphophorus couchianus]|uniref:dual specificity protein phosphatase 19-like isoform X1 n=1 Tax=Xiphophorus couchianus TaxID=32473 RepID=UPI001015F92B|nr:dual specificity protein phosphatase 19-like isoform X1 [Xiphophorus couchianus]
MHSLAQEIQGFSKNLLKKQSTRVTTVTGRKLLEKRCDGAEGEVEQVEELEEEGGCGFVEDTSLDLQVGVVRPFLLLASQDAAHDIDTMQRFKVSHVLNVAYGVTNLFPDQVVYKTLQILDLPETDLSSHLEECSSYIDQAKKQMINNRMLQLGQTMKEKTTGSEIFLFLGKPEITGFQRNKEKPNDASSCDSSKCVATGNTTSIY